MKIEVYCDESHPDLFSSNNPQAQYMVIGSLWLKSDDRDHFKKEIHALRNKYSVGGEFKWQKVSPSRIDFYKDLLSWFYEQNEDLRFRCIAINHSQVNLLKFHENDQELGFYKFYYQLLHHWIHDFNDYAVFCDYKSNRRHDRLHVLKRCLKYSNLSSTMTTTQAIRSKESVLIQLTDLLVGIASQRLNQNASPNSAKEKIVKCLESLLRRKIAPTDLYEKKFNMFNINLHGEW